MGLVPLASLLDAAEFYMEKEGLMVLEEDQKVLMLIDNDCWRKRCNKCPEKIELYAHYHWPVQVSRFIMLFVSGSPGHQQTWPIHPLPVQPQREGDHH